MKEKLRKRIEEVERSYLAAQQRKAHPDRGPSQDDLDRAQIRADLEDEGFQGDFDAEVERRLREIKQRAIDWTVELYGEFLETHGDLPTKEFADRFMEYFREKIEEVKP